MYLYLMRLHFQRPTEEAGGNAAFPRHAQEERREPLRKKGEKGKNGTRAEYHLRTRRPFTLWRLVINVSCLRGRFQTPPLVGAASVVPPYVRPPFYHAVIKHDHYLARFAQFRALLRARALNPARSPCESFAIPSPSPDLAFPLGSRDDTETVQIPGREIPRDFCRGCPRRARKSLNSPARPSAPTRPLKVTRGVTRGSPFFTGTQGRLMSPACPTRSLALFPPSLSFSASLPSLVFS